MYGTQIVSILLRQMQLLVSLALEKRDSQNANVFFFRRWDLVCRPRVPSEDRGNWG